MWTGRPISRTSSTASSSTSSCQSRRSTKKWTRRRECHISSYYTSHTSQPLTRGAKQLKEVNIFEIQSELMQLRLSPDAAVTPLWVRVSLICLTCLTCVHVNPFSVWHICWCASKFNQHDTKSTYTAGENPFDLLIYSSQAAAKCCGTCGSFF